MASASRPLPSLAPIGVADEVVARQQVAALRDRQQVGMVEAHAGIEHRDDDRGCCRSVMSHAASALIADGVVGARRPQIPLADRRAAGCRRPDTADRSESTSARRRWSTTAYSTSGWLASRAAEVGAESMPLASITWLRSLTLAPARRPRPSRGRAPARVRPAGSPATPAAACGPAPSRLELDDDACRDRLGRGDCRLRRWQPPAAGRTARQHDPLGQPGKG